VCLWYVLDWNWLVIVSGIFWTGIFEMPEVYIMVDYVVDRSLERAVKLWRYVELECVV